MSLSSGVLSGLPLTKDTFSLLLRSSAVMFKPLEVVIDVTSASLFETLIKLCMDSFLMGKSNGHHQYASRNSELAKQRVFEVSMMGCLTNKQRCYQ